MTLGSRMAWRMVTAGLVVVCAAAASAESVRCPAVKDVWVSSQPNEQDTSGGKTDVMKLKVLQEMALVGFDVSGLHGRQIKSAQLYLYPQPQQSKFVEGRPTELRWIVVSTVSSPWVEGSQSKHGEPDPAGHGASYREASSGVEPWAWKGGTLSDVINGNLNSVFSVHELLPDEGGYWKVPVDANVVQTLVAGLGDGLCLMDGSGTHQANPFIFSREAKGKEPYLLVEVEGEKKRGPAAVQIVQAGPDLSHATLDAGATSIKVKTGEDTLGLHVKVDGQMLEPWQVALPKNPGGQDVLVLQDMPAGKVVKVAIAAVDAAGNESQWTEAQAAVSDKASNVPDLPKSPFAPKAGEPKKVSQNLVAWAFPEVVKVDPISGQPLFEKDKDGYRLANPVWSGAEGKVRIAAARGEIAAFQVALEQVGGSASAEVSIELKNPSGQAIGANRVRIYRVWYVPSSADSQAQRPQARARRQAASQPAEPPAATQPAEIRWNAEYLVPIAAGKVQVPTPDNKVPNQKLQAVYVDVAVPGDAQAGTWTGRVRIKAEGGEGSLPLEMVVYPVRIPAELNFNPELNTYGGPAKAGSDAFYDWHRLAHYNRCTLNRVAYSQNGQVHEDMIPKMGGKGADAHVADWTEYDKRIGPLLDGSAFKDLPRDGVPVKTFYLPFFENWPMRLEGHYQPGVPPFGVKGTDKDGKRDTVEWKEAHDLTAPPIEKAFDAAYKEGFKNVVSQFLKHYDKKGWTQPLCEMYLNNKYSYGTQWWTLDEPTEWTDWDALAFFGRLFRQGKDVPHQAKFLFRGDISRPQWQAGFMGGLMDIMYSGSAVGFANPRLLMYQKERDGMLLYIYGSCNPVERNSYESAAWCLKAYSVGGDGVLPWQSVGGDSSFDQPNPLGLLVSGKRFAMTAVPSMRVMALRHGAQQCELLKQVLDRNVGWNRWHALALIQQKVPLEAVSNLKNVDQVTAAAFQAMTAQNFLELKEGLLQMLSKGKGSEPAAKAIQVDLPASGPQPQVVTYKKVGDVALDMHVIQPEKPGAKRPAIVWFVCGAWTGFTPSKYYAQSQYFASRGVVSFTALVRVKPRHGTTPEECVTDAKSAVRWVRKHAAEYGVDPDRIAVAGGSAGGHVSACTALVEGFEDPQDDTGISSRPNAAILFCPAVNTHSALRRQAIFGGLERARLLSPVLRVKPDAPPMLVLHGQADETIPVEEVIEFRDVMLAAGNRCDLKVYPGEGHGFHNWWAGKDNPMFAETVRDADKFLASLGWIAGEPTIDGFRYAAAGGAAAGTSND